MSTCHPASARPIVPGYGLAPQSGSDGDIQGMFLLTPVVFRTMYTSLCSGGHASLRCSMDDLPAALFTPALGALQCADDEGAGHGGLAVLAFKCEFNGDIVGVGAGVVVISSYPLWLPSPRTFFLSRASHLSLDGSSSA